MPQEIRERSVHPLDLAGERSQGLAPANGASVPSQRRATYQRGQIVPDSTALRPTEAQDPYAIEVAMPSGPLRGQPLDLSKRRSVFTLRPEHHALYGVQPGEVAVANFFHRGDGPDRHWVMRYRPEHLERVVAQRIARPFNTGHAQIRFDFKPGCGPILVPQDPHSAHPPVRIDSFVYSPETAVAQGQKFNVFLGLLRRSVVAHRFISLDAVHQHATAKGEKIDQYPLALSRREERNLLEWYIARSDREGYGKMFNTLIENCGKNTFDGLNAIRPDPYLGVLRWGGFLGAGNGFNTTIMRLLLHSRKLIAERDYPTLAEEFPDGLRTETLDEACGCRRRTAG